VTPHIKNSVIRKYEERLMEFLKDIRKSPSDEPGQQITGGRLW